MFWGRGMCQSRGMTQDGHRVMSQSWFGPAEHGAALCSVLAALATEPLSWS